MGARNAVITIGAVALTSDRANGVVELFIGWVVSRIIQVTNH